MKTKVVLVLCAICMSFLSFKTIEQELKTAVVIYDGYEYDVFSFSIPGEDDERDILMIFNEIPEDILKSFDLKSDKLVGESFIITYNVIPADDLDEDSEETYELKSLKMVEQ